MCLNRSRVRNRCVCGMWPCCCSAKGPDDLAGGGVIHVMISWPHPTLQIWLWYGRAIILFWINGIPSVPRCVRVKTVSSQIRQISIAKVVGCELVLNRTVSDKNRAPNDLNDNWEAMPMTNLECYGLALCSDCVGSHKYYIQYPPPSPIKNPPPS